MLSKSPIPRRAAGRRVALLAAAVVVGYFAYHLALGDRGIARLRALRSDLARAEAAHEDVAAQQEAWEVRVAPLRPATLDLDAVEERAREVLGFRRPGERVVVLQE